MSRRFLALRAALYAGGFVLLWGWLALWVRRFDDRLGGPLPSWLAPIGVVLALAGGALALWCIVTLVTAGEGTPAPFDAPRRFVVGGPYRWVRNPMYVGGIELLGGVGLAVRSPAVVLLAMLGLCLAHLFVLLYEEPVLMRTFGDSYREYRRRVRRWLPDPRGEGER